jgi:hypothetical protein
MSAQVHGEVRTFKYTGTSQFRIGDRVKIDGTFGLALAGATDDDLGVVEELIPLTGLGASQAIPVRLKNASGTMRMRADGAITNGQIVGKASNGEVTVLSSTGERIGVAFVPTGVTIGSDDIIEVMPDGWI